jgi:hypothetical protein
MKKVKALLLGLVCTVCLCSVASAQTVRNYSKSDGSSVTVKASKGMVVTDKDLQAIAELDRKDDAKKAEERAYMTKQASDAASEELDPQKRFRDRNVERAYTAELARQAEYERRSLAISERQELYNDRLRNRTGTYTEKSSISEPGRGTTTINREVNVNYR